MTMPTSNIIGQNYLRTTEWVDVEKHMQTFPSLIIYFTRVEKVKR